MKNQKQIKWKKYIIAFLITATVFTLAILLSVNFNEKKVVNVKGLEDKMFIDILSLETQFDLLEDLACKNVSENSTLSGQLQEIAQKLSYMEENYGPDNEEVIKLKRRYSLLEIKDILLMKKVAKKCDLHPIFILYFYSNDKKQCLDCNRQGYVLTSLAQQYPNLRVYSFDYNLDLSVLKTLLMVHSIENKADKLPILIVENKPLFGLSDGDKIQEAMPKLKEEIEKLKEEQQNKEVKDNSEKEQTQDKKEKEQKLKTPKHKK